MDPRTHASSFSSLRAEILHSNLRILLGWLDPEPEGLGSSSSSLRMPPLRAGLDPELLKLLDSPPQPPQPPP